MFLYGISSHMNVCGPHKELFDHSENLLSCWYLSSTANQITSSGCFAYCDLIRLLVMFGRVTDVAMVRSPHWPFLRTASLSGVKLWRPLVSLKGNGRLQGTRAPSSGQITPWGDADIKKNRLSCIKWTGRMGMTHSERDSSLWWIEGDWRNATAFLSQWQLAPFWKIGFSKLPGHITDLVDLPSGKHWPRVALLTPLKVPPLFSLNSLWSDGPSVSGKIWDCMRGGLHHLTPWPTLQLRLTVFSALSLS